MSKIINQIKDLVKNNTEITMNTQANNNKYEVVVQDKSNSVTSEWELLYRLGMSSYNNTAYDMHKAFSEVRIKNFNHIYTLIQQCYQNFMSGVNVEERYGTDFAIYQPDEKLWFTLIKRDKDVSIKLSITDEDSPFHQLNIHFHIAINQTNGQAYLVGYDNCYNQETNTFTEKYKASMLPNQKRVVPINKLADGTDTIHASGNLLQNGEVAINKETTEVSYIQEVGNERDLLAGIYEKAIIELVLSHANEKLTNQKETQSNLQDNNFGQPVSNNLNAFGSPAQNTTGTTPFGAPSQNNTPFKANVNMFNPALTTNTSGAY